MSYEINLTIDLYSNMCLADRLSVFLNETERPDKSRKLDLVKKFGQKEVNWRAAIESVVEDQNSGRGGIAC